MTRSVKIDMSGVTAHKARKLQAVIDRYRSTVNAYIRHLWENGGSLDKETLDVVPQGHLPYNYRGSAFKEALGVVSSTRLSEAETGNKASMPVYRGGMTLSGRTATVELDNPSGYFDIWLKVSTLVRGQRIWLPGHRHKVFNKWMSKPGAKLKDGFALHERNGKWFAILWVEVAEMNLRSEGKDIGVDCGINKILVTSEGQMIGREFKAISEKVRRSRPGSKNGRSARLHRDRYLNECVNKLPWDSMRLVAVEKLRNLKRGKKPNRGKRFRKMLAPWRYASVLGRIEMKAQEHCVSFAEVNPAWTSQCCPNCAHRERENRVNESFLCRACGFGADADYVGSRNIIARALGSVSSPVAKTWKRKASAER